MTCTRSDGTGVADSYCREKKPESSERRICDSTRGWWVPLPSLPPPRPVSLPPPGASRGVRRSDISRPTQYVRVGDRGVAEGPVLERVRRWTRRADPHRDLQEERRQGGRGPLLPVPEAGHSSARPLPGRVELQLQLRRRPLVTVESVCCPYQPSGLRLRHPNPGPHRPVCGRGEERRADGDVRADAAASAEADPKGESAVHRIALHLHLELPVPGGPGPVLLREVLRQRRALQLHQRVDLPELVGFAGGGRARARGRGRERRKTRHDQA